MPIFKNELKTVFDHGGVPSFNEFYNIGIFYWKMIYKGFLADWHTINAPTIANPTAKRKRNRMNYGKALCSELANLAWAEGSSISVNQKGWDSEEQDPLDCFIHHVLDINSFDTKMRQLIEESFALGGATIRSFVDGQIGDDGNIINGTQTIRLEYGRADQFVPISWDNQRVTEGVFIEKKARKGWYYTRLEFHRWNGEEYVVSNEVYKTKTPFTGNTSQDILGIRSPLSEIWENMAESVSFQDLSLGLFSYFRTCMANNLDDNSPLGISIYANCADTIKALDIAFDSLIQEMVLGRKRIIVPSSAIRKVRDSTGQEHRYFDASDEVYEALYTDSAENLQIKDNTVELRVEEHIRAINALLDILSSQVGLSEGSLSFDSAKGMKTATEVISENSKTYRTVKLMQEPIRQSIEDMIHNIIDIACAYDVEFIYNGVSYPVYDLVKKGYNISVSFDDSIIQDRNADIQEGINLLQNKVISRRTFLIDYLKLTPEQADIEIEQINKETKDSASARVLDVDWSNVGA